MVRYDSHELWSVMWMVFLPIGENQWYKMDYTGFSKCQMVITYFSSHTKDNSKWNNLLIWTTLLISAVLYWHTIALTWTFFTMQFGIYNQKTIFLGSSKKKKRQLTNAARENGKVKRCLAMFYHLFFWFFFLQKPHLILQCFVGSFLWYDSLEFTYVQMQASVFTTYKLWYLQEHWSTHMYSKCSEPNYNCKSVQ